MEIVDELFTPGCPQCAVKHLSAALLYAARDVSLRGPYGDPPSEEHVLFAQAYINLGEVLIGYESHLWYAVGLLQAAEETALVDGNVSPDIAAMARKARLVLETRGFDGVGPVLKDMRLCVPLMPDMMCTGHLREATRELPNFEWGRFNLHDAQGVVGAIEEIRSEYFSDPTVGPESEEPTNPTGEPEMATKKAPAKKAVAKKAVQAACKGGKCKPGKSCKK